MGFSVLKPTTDWFVIVFVADRRSTSNLSGDFAQFEQAIGPSPWAAMAFVDLCRLCGTDTLNVVRNGIFEGKGRAKKYALKISDCLTLRVSSRKFSQNSS
jgi:hypothetical protein